jgi:DNA-binding XRE family transcriptional regulator
VTRQAVHAALRPPPGGKPFVVRCRLCSTEINVNGALPRDAATALCLPCLARRPQAPFSQRLRAFRLAAGLTRNELARASGVAAGSISDYEEGRREPKWRQMAKLIRALGAGLVTLGLDDRGTGMTA